MATAMRVRTQNLKGIYNEYGFQIVVVGTNAVCKEEGNNPEDSRQIKNLCKDDPGALDIGTIAKFCDETGKVVAAQAGDRWLGCHQGEFV